MKINKAIYSFWTKPYGEHEWKIGGEFLTTEAFYSSWVLSVSNAKKHFDKVELYIDTKGWEILEPLNLPFTKVHVIFDELDKYHNELWAISKIYAYALQEEPFIHIDSDVYLWEGLPNEYLNSEIVVQSTESGFGFYKDMLIDYISRFWGTLDVIDNFIMENGLSKIIAFNCGIFGGTDIDFIGRYARKSIEFADIINDKFKTDPRVKYCVPCFFEQYLLAMMLDDANINPMQIMEESDFPNPKFKYTHLAAGAKKSTEADMLIKKRTSSDYPGSYDIIKKLIK